MALPVRSIRILGLHPIVPTEQQFQETMNCQWGEDLEGEELRKTRTSVKAHFVRLYLIEMEIEPPGAHVDWRAITQEIPGEDPRNWQAPWDEQELAADGSRWAFFLHEVDLSRPLKTPLGDPPLPKPTPIPEHLSFINYSAP